MKSYIAMAVLCMLASCAGTGTKKGEANTEEPKDSTFAFVGNPIVKNKFTADPAPMVHDGRLYLYVGHDEYYAGQDSASGGKEFNITEWLCYSTPDMKEWTLKSAFGKGLGSQDGVWECPDLFKLPVE